MWWNVMKRNVSVGFPERYHLSIWDSQFYFQMQSPLWSIFWKNGVDERYALACQMSKYAST